METILLIAALVIIVLIGVALYTTVLQKQAVGTQDKAFVNQQAAMDQVARSLALQEKSVALGEETNRLLRELLDKMEGK